jgi:hypothetical protein
MVMGMAKHDLITKDFALYVVHYFNSMQTWSKEDILGEIDRVIKEAKPEAAVRVVRCKDCKHYHTHNRSVRFDCNELYCCRSALKKVSPEDFCSFGERKDND